MNVENTKRIIDACPSLFDSMGHQRNKMLLGEEFLPIAFYFECEDGWVDILVELCKKIQVRLDELGDESADIVATQVKEKYGTLRFYVSYYDEAIECFIAEAERKSSCICSFCGKPGKLRGAFGWLYVACDEHTKEEDKHCKLNIETP